MAGERPLYATNEQMEMTQQCAVLGPLTQSALAIVDQFWDIGHAHRVRVIDEILFSYSAGTTIANGGDFRLLRARAGRSVANVVTDALKVTVDGDLAVAANQNVRFVRPSGEVRLAVTQIAISGTNTVDVTTAAHGIATGAQCVVRISGATSPGSDADNVDLVNGVHIAQATSSTVLRLYNTDGSATFATNLTNENMGITNVVMTYVPSTENNTQNAIYPPGQKVLITPTNTGTNYARKRLCLAPNTVWSMQPEYSLTASPQGHNVLDPGERLCLDVSGTLTGVANLYITCLYRLRRR